MLKRTYIAGHTGLLGSAMVRRMEKDDNFEIITRPSEQLDLCDKLAVLQFFKETQPKNVVMCAGRVAGILENQTFPADFITQNLAIQHNIITSAKEVGVERLIFFASSCIYPKECAQPMAEEQLYTGKLEPTSIAYAIAKLAGLEMCLAYNKQYQNCNFIPLIPNSVYGPHDNFNPEKGHVLSALIARMHEAKERGHRKVSLWGSGNPRREFLFADDLADCCAYILLQKLDSVSLPINVGSGVEVSIKNLANIIKKVVGYEGDIEWNSNKPDGSPRKLLDSSRLNDLGWRARTDIETGISETYDWYVKNKTSQGIYR